MDRGRDGRLLHATGHKLEESHLSRRILHSHSVRLEPIDKRESESSGNQLPSWAFEPAWSAREEGSALEVGLASDGRRGRLDIVQMGVENLLGERKSSTLGKLGSDGVERGQEASVGRRDRALPRHKGRLRSMFSQRGQQTRVEGFQGKADAHSPFGRAAARSRSRRYGEHARPREAGWTSVR